MLQARVKARAWSYDLTGHLEINEFWTVKNLSNSYF
jgi:hypothetical protein